MKQASTLLPDEGPTAPPRSNGELLFAAPWESRLFGLTLALLEQGRFEWSEFQQALIRAIARHEQEIVSPDEFAYYACWLEAFRNLAHEKGWFSLDALESLESELLARPDGHDH